MLFKNKKGGIILRDLFFILLIFAGIMTFTTLFVTDMADTYGNVNMSSEYSGSDISTQGGSLLAKLNNDTNSMKDATKGGNESTGLIGSLENVDGIISGITTVVGIVVKSPIYFGNAVTAVLTTLSVPSEVAEPIGLIISIFLYVTIIFVIVTFFSRGSGRV